MEYLPTFTIKLTIHVGEYTIYLSLSSQYVKQKYAFSPEKICKKAKQKNTYLEDPGIPHRDPGIPHPSLPVIPWVWIGVWGPHKHLLRWTAFKGSKLTPILTRYVEDLGCLGIHWPYDPMGFLKKKRLRRQVATHLMNLPKIHGPRSTTQLRHATNQPRWASLLFFYQTRGDWWHKAGHGKPVINGVYI